MYEHDTGGFLPDFVTNKYHSLPWHQQHTTGYNEKQGERVGGRQDGKHKACMWQEMAACSMPEDRCAPSSSCIVMTQGGLLPSLCRKLIDCGSPSASTEGCRSGMQKSCRGDMMKHIRSAYSSCTKDHIYNIALNLTTDTSPKKCQWLNYRSRTQGAMPLIKV